MITDYGYYGERDLYQGRQRRTQQSHPYSYDPFVIFGRENKEDRAVYTDRLRQWDCEKYERLVAQHFAERGHLNPHDSVNVQAFLSDYMGKPINLTCIMQHCNAATGYPLWTFHYTELPAVTRTAQPAQNPQPQKGEMK
jgi:hypothetical protein